MNLYKIIFHTQRNLLHIKYQPLFNKISSSISTLPIPCQMSGTCCCLSRNYHTSTILMKRRKSVEERKSTKIIEYSPKSKSPVVEVWNGITVSELANVLKSDVNYVQDLFLNRIKGPNTIINDLGLLQDAIKRSGQRMRVIGKPKAIVEEKEESDVFPRPPANKKDLKPRPPVVTIMGHVDHGKTTLLDALRNSNVVAGEFGGITQHIGAFSVELKSGARITFLDTPGHSAFTAMRERGANVTDIVVLVVAADDGVMEQTIESVRMAKQANVPILVAINKIDAPKADIERTKQKLIEIGIQVESMGGDVQAIPISALKKQNLEQLVEALYLQADLQEVKADPSGLVEAVVIESRLDQFRGSVCTLIIQRGTLRTGNILIAGTSVCKVRTMLTGERKSVKEVSPGNPVEVDGWKSLPSAGEQVLQVESERKAKVIAKIRENKNELEKAKEDAHVISMKEEQHLLQYKEKLTTKRRLGKFRMRSKEPRKKEIINDSTVPELNVVIKADVNGTLEALLNVISTYESEDCKLELINEGVGDVTENDLEMAQLFNGVVYAFNVKCKPEILEKAKENNVSVKFFNVIYKLIDDVKQEINRRLPSKEVEETLGEATIMQQFDINEGRKKVPVAGCKCEKGILKSAALFRLVRNEEIIYDGMLSSMRHLKNEVDTIKKGIECGIQLADKSITFTPGDKLICYEKKAEPQKTDWDPGF